MKITGLFYIVLGSLAFLGCGCDIGRKQPQEPHPNPTVIPPPPTFPPVPPMPTPTNTMPPYPPFPPTPPEPGPVPTTPPYPPFPPTPPENTMVCPQIKGYQCPCYDSRVTVFNIRSCRRVR